MSEPRRANQNLKRRTLLGLGGAALVAAVIPSARPQSDQAEKGPLRFGNPAAARAGLRAPADADYVVWDSSWDSRDLEDVFATELKANDILVLPERTKPYVIDSSEGFRAANVRSVTGRHGQVPIVSSYKGARDARTWFAMARATRGVLGLGPNAVIEMSESQWTQDQQIPDKGSVESDGWISPGRYYTDLAGVVQSELVGSQEKVLEADHPSPYFGNFTMRSHDLGGVAYSAIAAGRRSPVFERLDLTAAWRGFSGIPNGETAAISTSGSNYLISRVIAGTRDGTGKRVGTSPIMINASDGGTIEYTDASETYAGMLTLWSCAGEHILRMVNCRYNNGPGINLERTQDGFSLIILGGSIWSDYAGNGDKRAKPADQGTGGGMHIGLFAEHSARITLRGVDLDDGPTPGALNIQLFGKDNQQQLGDIECYDAAGHALPVQLHGGAA